MALKIDKDHWAFLEEIEAPMWADLSAEARCNYEEIDDGWFHTSHLYHHSHSFELKAAFAYSGEGGISSTFDFNGSSSPKLPSSVSGSRGMHHRIKRQNEVDHVLPWNKKHPVKVLTEKNSGSRKEINPKVSFVNSKGTWRSKQSLVVERGLTGNAIVNNFKAMSSHVDSEGSLSCIEDKVVDSNTSTVTFENCEKIQPNNLEVSSEAFGHSNGLWLALRTSLRKSCVTRKASRIDVSKRKDSRDSNAASGNSSVGSSSKPGYTKKNSTCALKQQKEQTDSVNVASMTRVMRSKVKNVTSSKFSNVPAKEGNCDRNSRTSTGSKHMYSNATKQKVQNQMLHPKALVPLRANEQRISSQAAKAQKMVRHNRLVSTGPENKPGRVPLGEKGNGGYITTGVMARALKGTKQDAISKGNRSRFSGPKEKGSSSRNQTITTQSIHLR